MRLSFLTDTHSSLEATKTLLQDNENDLLLFGGDFGFDPRELNDPKVRYVLGNHDMWSLYSRVNEIRAWQNQQRYIGNGQWEQISDNAYLVGIDGFADYKYAEICRIPLNDWNRIADFRGCSLEVIRRISQSFAWEMAYRLSYALFDLPQTAEKIVIVTHVPPFAEVCRYNGEQTSKEYLGAFSCQATGAVIKSHASMRRDTRFTVLCGHTHNEYEWHYRNIFCFVGHPNKLYSLEI